MGEEVTALTAELGYERTQDLVGRYDLLEQVAHEGEIDLAELITPLEEYLDLAPADMPVADEEPAEARAEAGLVRARPIRMEAKQASSEIAALAGAIAERPGVRLEFPRPTDANDRVLGAELAGAISRARLYEGAPEGSEDVLAELEFNGGSVAGQGFGAFNAYGLVVRVEGGAQDGAGKAMLGGTVAILKGTNRNGRARQRLGRQVVRLRGPARAPVRPGLGRLTILHPALRAPTSCSEASRCEPIDDALGCPVDRANAKGFAFEYMTSGRAVVIGDIGPWACAGMTGGRVYARVNPAWNLDRETIDAPARRGRQGPPLRARRRG